MTTERYSNSFTPAQVELLHYIMQQVTLSADMRAFARHPQYRDLYGKVHRMYAKLQASRLQAEVDEPDGVPVAALEQSA